uniref:Dimethylglycine dehydrogenase, mitochondrial n=1 Tax=Talaromyces marneffei PM1 TaxID=1077442 RepID=A0A093V1W4_TALMA
MSSTIIIVGGGIVGSALAHFLSSSSSSSSRRKIILIDNSLTPLQGSTAHAPGYVGQFNESSTLTRLAIDSVAEYAKIPNGFEVLGGIEAVATQEGISRLQTRCDAAVQRGLSARIITPAQAAGLAPDLVRQDDIQAALYFATDGVANATAITAFYQQQARRKGVEFVEGVVGGIRYGEDWEVVGVEVEEVVKEDSNEVEGNDSQTVKRKVTRIIETNTLILATGIWTQDLCADLNIPIPIIPVAHPYMYIKHDRPADDDTSSQSNISPRSGTLLSPSGSLSSSSSPSPLSNTTQKSPLFSRLNNNNNKPSPWVRYPEHQVYARDHGDFYGVGTYDHGPAMYCEPSDHVAIGPWHDEVFTSALERAKTLIPILATHDGEKDPSMVGRGVGGGGRVSTAMPETKFNGGWEKGVVFVCGCLGYACRWSG